MSSLGGVVIAATSDTNKVPAGLKADPAQAIAEAPNNDTTTQVAAHEQTQQCSPPTTDARRWSS